MKIIGLALVAFSILGLSGCGCLPYYCESVSYRQVMLTPTVRTVTVYDTEPVDVTTTVVSYD